MKLILLVYDFKSEQNEIITSALLTRSTVLKDLQTFLKSQKHSQLRLSKREPSLNSTSAE